MIVQQEEYMKYDQDIRILYLWQARWRATLPTNNKNNNKIVKQVVVVKPEDYANWLEEDYLSKNNSAAQQRGANSNNADSTSRAGMQQMWLKDFLSDHDNLSGGGDDDHEMLLSSKLKLQEAQRELRLTVCVVVFAYQINYGRKHFLDAKNSRWIHQLGAQNHSLH